MEFAQVCYDSQVTDNIFKPVTRGRNGRRWKSKAKWGHTKICKGPNASSPKQASKKFNPNRIYPRLKSPKPIRVSNLYMNLKFAVFVAMLHYCRHCHLPLLLLMWRADLLRLILHKHPFNNFPNLLCSHPLPLPSVADTMNWRWPWRHTWMEPGAVWGSAAARAL